MKKPEHVPQTPKIRPDRREFLRWSAFVGGSLLLGCGTDEGPAATAVDSGGTDGGPSRQDAHVASDSGGGVDATDSCPDPFATATFVGLLPFVQEGGKQIAKKYGTGWDGRYYCDLEKLDLDTLTMPIGQFYIRTVFPDTLTDADLESWSLKVEDGSGGTPTTVSAKSLIDQAKDLGVHLMECSGNGKGGKFGLISAASWKGVKVTDVLPKAAGTKTHVLIEGYDKHATPSANNHSKPGASWIFTLEQLKDAFLATHMNGELLPKDHGKPVRLIVPGWYGCCNIKWVNRIAWVDEDVPATAQMKEFASRTHQKGIPQKAKDYIPATMDQAAMPIRLEKWQLSDGAFAVKVIGVMWGGYEVTDALQAKFGQDAKVPVTVCPKQSTNATWTLWTHTWQPTAAGSVPITMHIDDAKIPTRRLDLQWYKRVAKV